MPQCDNGDYSDLIHTKRLFCELARLPYRGNDGVNSAEFCNFADQFLTGQFLAGAKSSKWPRCCSKANNASAGSPASAHIAKNHGHPVAVAMKPAAEER